jgi:hypothetical protein
MVYINLFKFNKSSIFMLAILGFTINRLLGTRVTFKKIEVDRFIHPVNF